MKTGVNNIVQKLFAANIVQKKFCLHGKKRTTCSGLMKTALNNAVLPTLFNVVNNIAQHC